MKIRHLLVAALLVMPTISHAQSTSEGGDTLTYPGSATATYSGSATCPYSQCYAVTSVITNNSAQSQQQKEEPTMFEAIGVLACIFIVVGAIAVLIISIVEAHEKVGNVDRQISKLEKRLNDIEQAAEDAKGPSPEEITAVLAACPGFTEDDARAAIAAYLAV